MTISLQSIKLDSKKKETIIQYLFYTDSPSNEEISVHDDPNRQQHIDSADYQQLFHKVLLTTSNLNPQHQ